MFNQLKEEVIETKPSYDELIQLVLERGFFFPSAEIYHDAPAGFWEYGPVGLFLRENFVREWRHKIVRRDDMLEIDGSLILPKIVFEASGHLSSLSDPIVECTNCGTKIRADKFISEKTGLQIDERLSPDEFQSLVKKHGLKCPKCGGELGKPTKFNMMFRVGVGAENVDAYLRPETAQSIFLDFARLSKTMRVKLPKGIAQVGRSFRNEIAPRQSLVRLRELVQAEVEVFFNPTRKIDQAKLAEVSKTRMNFLIEPYPTDQQTKAYTVEDSLRLFKGNEIMGYYLGLLQEFYESIGFKKKDTRFRQLSAADRAFYTTSAFDFEVKTSLGWLELVACNYRTDYDLTNHGRVSKQDLSVMDDNQKVVPHVMELSIGVDRSVLSLLDQSYYREPNREVLRLRPNVSPYLAAIFPLVSKHEFETKAREIFESLKEEDFATFYDDSGAIGRRYRRMDQIGTPFCITVDHQTIQDDTVTLRERDSMEQTRVGLSDLAQKLRTLRSSKN